MNIFNYFDLGLFPEEAELGSKKEMTKKRRKQKHFFITILFYLFLWLGILSQRYMELYQSETSLNWSNFGQEFPVIAFIVATAIFPLVFPKVFAKMPARARKAEGSWFFVQLCVAFQNGFFWQALLSLIAPR